MKNRLLFAAALMTLAQLTWADDIVTIDSNKVSGRVVAITGDSVIVRDAADKEQTIKLEDVEQIVGGTGSDPTARNGQGVVITASGSVLAADNVVMAGEKLKFDNPLLGTGKELDMGSASWVYLPPAGKTAADAAKICSAMKMEDKSQDTLVVQRKAGDYWPLQGVLKDLTADTVVFTRNGQDVKVARANVLAIRLAMLSAPKPTLGKAVLSDKLSSWIEFDSITMKDGKCELQTKDLGKLTVEQSSLASMQMHNTRLTPLSSLEPASVKEHGLLGLATPFVKNRSTTGGPLKIGEVVFASGLGMHSYCELTYKIDGQYKQFVAVAGIDEAARPAGNAQLTILGDGKELAKPLDLTGKAEATMLRIKVEGVKVLTIRVDYGQDKVDVGDHVTLGGAKLVK